MNNKNLIRLINFGFILFIFLFFFNDAFAKSTDKKKFLKLYKKTENLIIQNKELSVKTYNLLLLVFIFFITFFRVSLVKKSCTLSSTLIPSI